MGGQQAAAVGQPEELTSAGGGQADDVLRIAQSATASADLLDLHASRIGLCSADSKPVLRSPRRVYAAVPIQVRCNREKDAQCKQPGQGTAARRSAGSGGWRAQGWESFQAPGALVSGAGRPSAP